MKKIHQETEMVYKVQLQDSLPVIHACQSAAALQSVTNSSLESEADNHYSDLFFTHDIALGQRPLEPGVA